jgi:hypothetical protein
VLKAKRVEPSNELVQLYRTLLEKGGHASLLSLPSAGFVVAAVRGAPEELLRQLNVTARYQDKPPIMFRLAFAPAPEEPPPAEAAPVLASVPPVPAASAAPTPAAVAPTAPSPVAAAPAPIAANATTNPVVTPPAVPVAAASPTSAAGKPAPAPTAASTTASPAVGKPVETPSPPKPAHSLDHSLDQEEARLAAITPPLALPKRETNSVTPTLGPSEEKPPAGSLLASIWKPSVLETLPEEAQERNYDIVEYARVGSLIGRYVQVITEGGKKIGGLVLGVDDTGVKLQVNREGGNITFVVAKARVQEIRLPRY